MSSVISRSRASGADQADDDGNAVATEVSAWSSVWVPSLDRSAVVGAASSLGVLPEEPPLTCSASRPSRGVRRHLLQTVRVQMF